jgi:hypothetical protein
MTNYEAGPLGAAINEFTFVQAAPCTTSQCTRECWSFYGSVAPYSGTGGATSSGGATGAGGATGVGGVTGTGGVTSAGGSSSIGGVTSVGGSSNTGGAISNPCDIEGGTLLYGFNPEEGDAAASSTLAGITLTTGYVDLNQSTLTLDSTIGSPEAGSAKLYVPFDGKKPDGTPMTTSAELAYLNIQLEKAMDLTGKSLFACIRLDEGLFAAEDACGRMALGWSNGTSSRPSVIGDYENLCVSDRGRWLMLNLPVVVPDIPPPGNAFPPDSSSLSNILIQLTTACPATGLWGNVCAAGPSYYGSMAVPATFHIDSIGYR